VHHEKEIRSGKDDDGSIPRSSSQTTIPNTKAPYSAFSPPKSEITSSISCSSDATPRPSARRTSGTAPDYPASRAIDVALLRTCRRVYLETWNLPLMNVTHRRWLGWDGRRCPAREFSASLDDIFGVVSLVLREGC
jgi:hypothetical protein